MAQRPAWAGSLARRRFRSALQSLRTWPDRQGWRDSAVLGAAAALLILTTGIATGLLSWQPSGEGGIGLFLGVLVAPALLEEFVFRGLATPARGETRRPALAISLGLSAYVLWHVAGALLLPGAEMFLRPDFLFLALLLGLACAIMRYRTGSLWPAVLFHAIAVWAWQAFLGGISPADLL